jgi:hypothetical protein
MFFAPYNSCMKYASQNIEQSLRAGASREKQEQKQKEKQKEKEKQKQKQKEKERWDCAALYLIIKK